LRDTARNILQELKVKPYTNQDNVEPDWSEGWNTVPWEFVEYILLFLPELVNAVYDPRFATLKGFSGGQQKGILQEVSRAALIVSGIKGGAVSSKAREAYRAQAWTKAACWLQHYVTVDEANVLGLGDSLEKAVSEAERCLGWFQDEAQYRDALGEAGKLELSLITGGEPYYDGDFPTSSEVSKAFFCPPGRLRDLIDSGKKRRDEYRRRWEDRGRAGALD
jgi:hypothetical protein